MPQLGSNRSTARGTRLGIHRITIQFDALFPDLPASRTSSTPPWQNPNVPRMRGWSATAPHIAPVEYMIERHN